MSPLVAVLAAATGTSARIVIPHIDYGAILPELILLGGVLVLIGLSAMTSRRPPTGVFAAATVGIAVAALVASLRLWRRVQDHGAFTTIAHSVDVDGFAVYFLVLVSAVLVVVAILGAGYLRREGIEGCEYYALALISGSGAMFMASANDLILIFLALEVLSIPLYVLAGFARRRSSSTASRSSTARPARRTCRRSRRSSPTTSSRRTACCSPGSRSSSSASRSRSRRCRSTCGPPTSTRARPRR